MPPDFEKIRREEALIPPPEIPEEEVERILKKTERPAGELAAEMEVEKPPSTEDPDIEPGLKEKAAETNLEAMRDVFRDIQDYAVFASTAMYLQGKEKQIPELLEKKPGDFDATVFSEESLNKVREKLSNMPGVKFENDGQYIQFANEKAKVLRGRIRLGVENDGDLKEVDVPFEIFLDSRIVSKELPREEAAGLKTLSLEGLSGQYMNNLNYESRIKRTADSVLELLANPLIKDEIIEQLQKVNAGQDADPLLQNISSEIDLTPEQIGSVYTKIKEMIAQNYVQSDPRFNEELIAHILEMKNQKTKIPKRVADLEKLQQTKRIEV
ncbi:MAG: hypothetical protein ABII13_05550 [Patescibacteria group bacterium]|nr:hypothetical protein [Patescibacteria group bacterium]MBU2509063.1 hypothetical protein [Patescibacteria group bacterium]